MFPILLAINSLGGEGTVNEILPLVEQRMRGVLNRFDYERLANGNEIRWRNTARWARAAMVNLGLLSDSSPDGVWQLTDLAKDFLYELR